jgi:glycosyltransferase involved in cell wall biosynthesis
VSELSILVPCRNDAATLTDTLAALHNVVAYHSMSVETLIVDDGSEDDTVRVAVDAAHRFPALHVRVLVRKHLRAGLGGTLRYGMAFALGRNCILLSAQGDDPVELLPTFLFHLRAGKQLVQCSRYLSEADAAASPMLLRLCQALYRTGTRVLLGINAADTTYSFRAFDRVFIQALGLSSTGYNVCPEMTLKVILCGGAVEHIPGKPGARRSAAHHRSGSPLEIPGYSYVLLRAALHRVGLLRWF